MRHRPLAVLAATLATAVLAPAAPAAPGLVIGLSDDYLKTEPARAAGFAHDLGVDAIRVTVDWRPGQTTLSPVDESGLQGALTAAGSTRVVVLPYSDEAEHAPTTPQARQQYCAFVSTIVQRFPQVNDVVIWNEPNKRTFWKPQFESDASAAPAAYLELLLHCHHVLHELRPSLNVIHAGLSSTGNDRPDAQSNVSHSPGNFVREEGEAYRALHPDAASGPVAFDTFALHAYGESSLERPWEQHPASATIAMGDIGKLVHALWDAFARTGQPVPKGGPSAARTAGAGVGGIWILENGYQSIVPQGKIGSYTGAENVPVLLPRVAGGDDAVPAPTQSRQVVDALRVAWCSPYVTGYFNFLLRDDGNLAHWQSGLVWADWTHKPAYHDFKQAIRDARAGTLDCAGLPAGVVGEVVPREGVDVRRVAWPKARRFNWKHDLWRLRIQPGEAVTYEARVVRVGGPSAKAGRPVLRTRGELRKLYFVIVKFPERRLAPGRYRMEITLTSAQNASRVAELRGPVLVVKPRRR